MAREIDERKKRKALRKLRKAAALAEQGLGPPLTDWERTFLEEVEERIETYGSAFHDSEKGAADEPLSALQALKLREIDKKARGKGLKRGGFQNRKAPRKTADLDINAEDVTEDTPTLGTIAKPILAGPQLVRASDMQTAKPRGKGQDQSSTKPSAARRKTPALRVIKGGQDKT
ncbi:MAG: hypothetical protein AAGF20_13055 [Pseudomonadota bacterium]